MSSEDESFKKPKTVKKTQGSIGDTFKRLLERPIKDTNPILSKHRKHERELAKEKSEKKKKSINRKEKLELKDRNHLLPDPAQMNYEKQLRRISTKGVVQLFNAIGIQQKKPVKVNPKDKAEIQATKNNFLEMLKIAAK